MSFAPLILGRVLIMSSSRMACLPDSGSPISLTQALCFCLVQATASGHRPSLKLSCK